LVRRLLTASSKAPGMRQNRWVICANASGRESDYHQKAWWEPRFDKFVTQITRILTSDDELPCHDSCYVIDQNKRMAQTCGK
ncbi:hypothetical protein E4U19_007738, partial [Claviceps sp. Clav32 group G5]